MYDILLPNVTGNFLYSTNRNITPVKLLEIRFKLIPRLVLYDSISYNMVLIIKIKYYFLNKKISKKWGKQNSIS